VSKEYLNSILANNNRLRDKRILIYEVNCKVRFKSELQFSQKKLPMFFLTATFIFSIVSCHHPHTPVRDSRIRRPAEQHLDSPLIGATHVAKRRPKMISVAANVML